MKKKIKVAVLMGGKTPEHEISLISGREVIKNLPKEYLASPIVISRDGKTWLLVRKSEFRKMSNPLELVGTKKDAFSEKQGSVIDIKDLSRKFDVCFIAMHGPFGEDGTIQGLLGMVDMPYTGPGVLASALCMDKLVFRKVMVAENIAIPRYVAIKKNYKIDATRKKLGKFPYFVKPSNQGSSVGISKANSAKELKRSIKEAFKYSNTVLVDECVVGREITCGVIGNEKPIALPIVEIKPQLNDFFDYDSKYKDKGAEEIVPALMSRLLTRKIQDMAIKVYKACGCRGFSRVDFILKNNQTPVVLEINTIPGLTPMSLMPKEAKAAGMSYSQFLDRIVRLALK